MRQAQAYFLDIYKESNSIRIRSAILRKISDCDHKASQFQPQYGMLPIQQAALSFAIREASMQSYFLLLILFRMRNRCKISVSPDTSTCVFANQTALRCDTPS